MRRALILLFLLSWFGDSLGQYSYPGGVADLRIEKQNSEIPEIRYGIREPVILEEGDHWRVLIGISLDTLPGDYLLYLKHSVEGTTGEHRKFTVMQKSYQLIDDEASSAAPLHRVRNEISSIDFSNTQQPTLPLQLPLEGAWTESFGYQVMARESLIVQNAVSLTTTELANVVSPQDAIVSKIETGEDELSTVYLDHGRGLYSIIEGLTDLTVEIGNGVVAGAVIGRLPDSDLQVEPKTLVWQTQMNGEFVNPLILTQIKP